MRQDFICLDRFFSGEDVATYGNLIQVPLMGQAIVMAYNIPSLSSLNTSLVRMAYPSPASQHILTLRSHVGVHRWIGCSEN
jgi:hypothetical protein